MNIHIFGFLRSVSAESFQDNVDRNFDSFPSNRLAIELVGIQRYTVFPKTIEIGIDFLRHVRFMEKFYSSIV